MGRRLYIALTMVVCAVVLAALAWVNRPRDDPARATVDDAVRSYREQAGGEGEDGGPGPAHGVYRYATRGGESAQNVLADASHDYRGVSTIALSPGRCGQLERWQVLAGRWTEFEACSGQGGVTLRAAKEFHEFFGVGQEDSFRCRGTAMPDRSLLRPGTRFSSSCESDGSSVASTSRVVGFEPVSVGGESFAAVHIASRTRLEGETVGSARRDEWRRRSDGLLLRRSAASAADTSAGGGTRYTERYTLRLLDPEPRR